MSESALSGGSQIIESVHVRVVCARRVFRMDNDPLTSDAREYLERR
jgi:hypothetical protein